MKDFPRNSRCPCGSGKKYKHCHLGKNFNPSRDMSIHNRNLILLRAAEDIFGFTQGRSWADFKTNISGEQIRALYEVHASYCVPGTDWTSLVPSPDGKLRGLYLGDIRPELTLKNIIRFSLYSDNIFVINPFMNPHILRPEYNPLDNPDQFKVDTISLVHFLFSVAPWIKSGMLLLLPDPGDLNLTLKRETWRLAKERLGDREPDPDDVEEAHEQGLADLRRIVFALPEDDLLRQLEKAGMTLTDDQKRRALTYARQALRNDPIALEQPPGASSKDGQLLAFRAGTNLETALLICGVTGAFPYTNMSSIWRQIIEARDEMNETARVWSPLTRSFQSLDLRFLNNTDARFAQGIREDGRLESFRTMLRKIGKGATDVTDISSLESFVRDCTDELIGEYHKAEAEWSKIDESFVKWTSGGVVAAAGAFATGHLVPSVAALSTAMLHTMSQLGLRYIRQGQFRKANPMSVLIDLSRKEPTGTTIY